MSKGAASRPRARALAAATPATRNRYADLLRVASIGVVVIGHWLIAVIGWEDGGFTGQNLLALSPGMRILTWVFQVMPVFFIVGGFANAGSWESARGKGARYADWLRSRSARLLRPALVFVAFWTVLPMVAVALGLPAGVARTGGREVALPLWFLAIYLLAVACVPPLLAAHRRFGGARVVIVLAAATALVDVAHFGLGLPHAGVANFAFVWLAVIELGFLWRDGALTDRSRTPWLMAGGGLLAVVLLVTLDDYPVSMIALTGAERSNTFPPSLALLALAVWQCGATLIFQKAANRWLARARVWLAVVVANGMIMTLYLWNMTAVVLASVLLFPTGLAPQPEPLGTAWWLLRPAWIAICAICLAPFVAGFRWAERPAAPPPPASAGWTGLAGTLAGTALAGVGLGILAAQAFPVQGEVLLVPAVGIVCVALGAALLRVNPIPRGQP